MLLKFCIGRIYAQRRAATRMLCVMQELVVSRWVSKKERENTEYLLIPQLHRQMHLITIQKNYCIRKTKNTFCGKRASVGLPKFYEKNCFCSHNFTEMGQLAAELRLITQRPSTILKFEKSQIIWLHDSSSSKCCAPNFIEI